jgi:hypothetical protein
VRLFILILCIAALVILGSQLSASSPPIQYSGVASPQETDFIVGTTFPEPISTVFLLSGAAALGLWKLAQRLNLI